jgi:hypothetical protein
MSHHHEGGAIKPGGLTFDMVFGAVVFGIVGAAIGYYINATASIPVAGVIGTVLGLFIGILGGRRFFISIVCGAVLGAALFGLVSGRDVVALGAGIGGAMGGFLGVQIGMLLDLWRQRKESIMPEQPPQDTNPQ